VRISLLANSQVAFGLQALGAIQKVDSKQGENTVEAGLIFEVKMQLPEELADDKQVLKDNLPFHLQEACVRAGFPDAASGLAVEVSAPKAIDWPVILTGVATGIAAVELIVSVAKFKYEVDRDKRRAAKNPLEALRHALEDILGESYNVRVAVSVEVSHLSGDVTES